MDDGRELDIRSYGICLLSRNNLYFRHNLVMFIYSNLDKNVYANVETKCSTQTNLIYKMHDKCCLLFAFSSDNLSSPHLLVAPSKIDKLYSEYANG